MGNVVAKVSISFGLINIPVAVSVAARPKTVHFKRLHKCGHPINQRYTCKECGEDTQLDQCTRGHEIGKGHFVTVTEQELSECEPKSNKVMRIEKCVAAHEIDPMLYESSYFLEPEPAGKSGYKLLYEALAEENLFAIAKVTMSSREHVVIIRPFRGCLAFHRMFFEDEIRSIPSMGLHEVVINPAELELAKQLLRVNQSAFLHGEYSDGYLQAVESLLAQKQAEMPALEITGKRPNRPTVDLLKALRASVDAKQPAPAPSLTLVPTRKKRQRKQAIAAAEVKAS